MAVHIEKGSTAAEVAGEIEANTMTGKFQPKRDMEKPTRTAISRLKGIIRGHLDSMAMARRPSISEENKFSKLEEGSVSSTARRRAERISLCRPKIRNLTGHGNMRKPIAKASELSAKNIGERHHAEQPLLMPGSIGPTGKLNVHEAYPSISREYSFGDLKKSFMNTVDKFDFHQTPQQTPESVTNSKRRSLLPGLHQQDSKMTHIGEAATVKQAGTHTSRPEPGPFSVSRGSLGLTPTNEQRPNVNPLRCHPNVTSFAEQLADPTEILTPPPGTSTPGIEITKEAEQDLQTAPIYSPSSGNLSQYTRLTPSPARSSASSVYTALSFTPGNLYEIPFYTPTRASGRTAAAEHAAHQREGEMVARRGNPQLFSDHQLARTKENRKNGNPRDGAMKSKTTSTEGWWSWNTKRKSTNATERPGK
jgi:hypothetical protein